MSWLPDINLGFFHDLCLRLIKCGRIPKHVGIIMDGNRRFARKKNVEKTEGHVMGFDKFSETIRWCYELGISEITVFAFSIDNFQRSKEEVDYLMNLAMEKLGLILKEEKKKLLDRDLSLRIRVLGNKEYLSEDLIKLIDEVQYTTKDNYKTKLNVALSYTGKDDLTQAVNLLLGGLNDGSIDESDLNLNLFSQCLHTKDSPYPDMIIRTSGETRLSNFLLWQGSCSYIHFTGKLWPEFTLWDLLWAVFKYQCVAEELDIVRNKLHSFPPLTSRGSAFINAVNKEHMESLKKFI